MASNIKGITVEIGGDTTKLDKALKEVNTSSKSLQGELKSVDKALKLDPTNVNLLKQKQDLLKESIVQTSDKLKILKSTQEQVQEQFKKGEITENQYRAVQREIENTEIKLKSLKDNLKSSSAEMQSFGAKAAEVGEKLNKVGENTTKVGKTLSTGLTLPIIGVGTAAVALGNNFESSMSRVKAISGSTGEEFEKLKKQALDLGESTAFSAKEVSLAQENLASAGFSVNEIMSALPGLLDLAASSGEDLGSSADITASTLRGFGLEAEQAGHVADVLAKNAADTNAAVKDTGEAMKYVAPAAKAAGIELEEVTAAIGVMANAGIQGSQSGTTLRTALTRLASPSKEAAKAMSNIGFNAFDSEGKMKSLSDIIGDYQVALQGKTDQEQQDLTATIFGQEAMSGMLVLMDSGKENLQSLTEGLKNSDGAASEMAKTMQDNTSSSIEQMFGAMETAAIKIQEVLAPTIKAIADSIGNMVSAFSNLSPETQKTIIAILSIVAAIGPLLVVIGKLLTIGGTIASAIGVMTGAITVATPLVMALAGVFTFLISPIGLIVIAITAVVVALSILWNTNEGFKNAVIEIWEGIKTAIGTAIDGIVNFFTVTIPGAINSMIAWFTELPNKANSFWENIKTIFSNWCTLILVDITTIWNNISTFFSNLWTSITEIFNIAISTIVEFMTNNFSGAIDGIKQIFDGLSTYLNGIWEVIKTIFLGTILIIIDIVTGNFSALKTDTENIFNNLKDAFSQIWEGIKLIFNGALQVIHNIVSTIWNSIKTETENLWNGIKSFFDQLWTSIQTNITNAWNNFKNIISTTCINISNEVNSIWNGILSFFAGLPSTLYTYGVNAFTSLRNGINTILSTLGSVVSNGFSSAISFITSLPSQAYEWGVDFISGIVKGIKASIGKVKDAVEDVADTIRSYLHFSVPDIGPLTDYETYMPDFMQGLANGINKSKHLVTSAIGGLATEMSVGVNPNAYNSTVAKSSNSNIAQKQDVYLALNIENFNNNNNADINELSEKLLFNIKRGL